MTWKLPDAKTIFASLANMAKRERARPRRARKRLDHMEQQRRARAGVVRRRKRLQREATAEAARRHSEQWAGRVRAMRPAQTIGAKIMGLMEPGKWYGARDLANMSGVRVRNVRATLIQKLIDRGLVEKELNPAFKGVGNPQENMANPDVEPYWLYKLTAAGEALVAVHPRQGEEHDDLPNGDPAGEPHGVVHHDDDLRGIEREET